MDYFYEFGTLEGKSRFTAQSSGSASDRGIETKDLESPEEEDESGHSHSVEILENDESQRRRAVPKPIKLNEDLDSSLDSPDQETNLLQKRKQPEKNRRSPESKKAAPLTRKKFTEVSEMSQGYLTPSSLKSRQ